MTDHGSKYIKTILPRDPDSGEVPIKVDIYSVIHAWDVTDGGLQHALKKVLMPGTRGSKTYIQDLEEAIVSIRRAIATRHIELRDGTS